MSVKVPNFAFYFGSLLISESVGRHFSMKRAIQVLDNELPRESALRKELIMQGMKLTQYEPLTTDESSWDKIRSIPEISETAIQKPVRRNQYGDVIEDD